MTTYSATFQEILWVKRSTADSPLPAIRVVHTIDPPDALLDMPPELSWDPEPPGKANDVKRPVQEMEYGNVVDSQYEDEDREKETQTTGSESARNAAENPDSYLNAVKEQIERHKHYPHQASRKGFAGNVIVGFKLFADGKAAEVTLVQGSGYDLLDEAGLTAVKSAVPFAPLPGALRPGPLSLEVVLVFRLRR